MILELSLGIGAALGLIVIVIKRLHQGKRPTSLPGLPSLQIAYAAGTYRNAGKRYKVTYTEEGGPAEVFLVDRIDELPDHVRWRVAAEVDRRHGTQFRALYRDDGRPWPPLRRFPPGTSLE